MSVAVGDGGLREAENFNFLYGGVLFETGDLGEREVPSIN